NIDPANVALNITLPTNQAGGGLLKMSATLNYHPYFYPSSSLLVGTSTVDANKPIKLGMDSQVRLKNTLEVAMVLDNSGSMTTPGTGSGQKRIDLLKTASKQLVDTLALQAAMIKQVD
ncbi:hypothetical protein EN823_14055, partial [bacterium M00.F.Ca.ET.180.01.1.1]